MAFIVGCGGDDSQEPKGVVALPVGKYLSTTVGQAEGSAFSTPVKLKIDSTRPTADRQSRVHGAGLR